MDLFNQNIDLVSRMLSASTRRHEVIATNLANINVPNYKAREFRFDEAFESALASGDVDRALEVSGEVVIDDDAPVKADGNSVRMDREFGKLQKNQLAFGFYAGILQQRLATMRRAISGNA